MRKAVAICGTLAAFATATLQAQDAAWRQDNDRGNRYEGVRASPIANDDLELLAMFVNRPILFTANSILHARFHIPKDTKDASSNVRVYAWEINLQKYYWLESKPESTHWKAGQAAKFEWSTEVLEREAVEPDNLGVLAQLSSKTVAHEVAPILLALSSTTATVKEYRIILRANQSLGEMTWTVTPETKSSLVLAQGKLTGEHYPTTTITLVMTPKKLVQGVWYLMRIRAPRQGEAGIAELIIRFQHHSTL
jgi:hypothetical protein